jgi:OOP family OmpA-OmpF porin
MKIIRSCIYPAIILFALVSLNACKAKKLPPKPTPPPVAETPPPVQKPAPTPPPPAPTPPPPVAKPDYNFGKIQFEFDSGILKTDSYPVLDKAAAEMKKDPSVTFVLNGYASAEGTADHNMELSVQRANAVKAYLVNSGISNATLTAKGFGEANPVADNTTDAGKILNRRVEIKLQN